jgi:hypothetical protein
MPNWFSGGDPTLFNDPNQGTTTAAITQLSSSKFGQQGAQQAERSIGRRFQDQQDQLKSNPAFGRNAAVTSALTDRAAETAGEASGDAVTKGAQVDASARERAAGLSMQQSGQLMQENELNYQREEDASFGNSFLGHLAQNVIGTAAGAFTGGLASGAAANITGQPIPTKDATFGKGEIKMLVGKDGKTYAPRSDDGVSVGTRLGAQGNQLLQAGAVAPAGTQAQAKAKFAAPMGVDFPTYKLGHKAYDFSTC